MRFLTVAALAVAVLLPGTASAATPVTSVTRSYVTTSEALANPGRGFFAYTETHLGGDFEPLAVSSSAGTLVYRHYYLEKYRAVDQISAADLALIGADLTAARKAGVKLVLRFSYGSESDADAPKPRVLGHIAQLGPLLTANADVIFVLQAGFIGQWGEWYYSAHFSSSPGVLTAQNWADRKAVLAALLAATAPTTLIQVRTPEYKRRLFPQMARIGLHNDCFLAGADDYGTYTAPDDTTWLAASTTTLVGGETCDVSARSGWPNAGAEMARYHWTYLNPGFNEKVLASWGTAGRAEVSRRLGYRLRLVKATLPAKARPGAIVTARITLANDGYAAPAENRPVHLLLNGRAIRVAADPRTWEPGRAVTLSVAFTAPARGSYRLALNLPDASPRLARTPAYSIHLANPGVWDAARGWNSLNSTLTVW